MRGIIFMQMKKQKLQKNSLKIILSNVTVIALASLFVISSAFPRITQANSISEQINALNQQNAANRAAVASLEEQAISYQDAINQLRGQINQLQAKINENISLQADLKQRIIEAEAELEKQKTLLGKNIRAMYLEGEISTLEMLASSNDLSEFLNKQEYRDAVQAKIKITLDKITALKLQLKTQKESVDALLAEQVTQQAQLADAKYKQDQLLAYNQHEQATYNQKTKDNQRKIDDLIAQQRRANFNPDGGYYFLRFNGNVNSINPDSYKYRNAGFGMSPYGCNDNDGPDEWGYCTRQCVSYTAWAVEASGRSAPRFYGNAKDWVAAAYARGVPVYRTPLPGDVAISTAGYWGHAMYVESVSGNSFNTSEYNTHLDGRLSYQTRRF